MRKENRLLCTLLLLDIDNNSCSYSYARTNNDTLSHYYALPDDDAKTDDNTTHVRIRRCLPKTNGVET
jgi:hypothetical protein